MGICQHFKTLTVILLVTSAMFGASLVLAEDQPPPATVSVADIGTKVALVGRLGQPLGAMMTLRGRWAYPVESPGPVKDNSIRFTVSHVNGKQLAQPVEFNVAQIDAVSADGKSAIPGRREGQAALDGVSWTFRAYETGRFDKIPEEYWKERGTGPPGLPYWTTTFTSKLVGIVQGR